MYHDVSCIYHVLPCIIHVSYHVLSCHVAVDPTKLPGPSQLFFASPVVLSEKSQAVADGSEGGGTSGAPRVCHKQRGQLVMAKS